MADSQDSGNAPQPPAYVGFTADDEALAAARNDTGPSLWSLGGPILFFALLTVLYVLQRAGVVS